MCFILRIHSSILTNIQIYKTHVIKKQKTISKFIFKVFLFNFNCKNKQNETRPHLTYIYIYIYVYTYLV